MQYECGFTNCKSMETFECHSCNLDYCESHFEGAYCIYCEKSHTRDFGREPNTKQSQRTQGKQNGKEEKD